MLVPIAVFVAARWLARVDAYSVNIPAAAPVADYIEGVAWAAFLTGLVALWFTGPERRAVLTTWALRLVVVLVAMLWYERKYDFLDSYTYFKGAQFADQPWDFREFGNGTALLHEIAWLHARVLVNSFHAMVVSWALVGEMAVIVFARAFRQFAPEHYIATIWILGLTPTVFFWSSTLGKDPVVFIAIALFTSGFLTLVSAGARKAPVQLLGGLALAAAVRPWMALILVVSSVLTMLFLGQQRARNLPLFLGLALLLGATAVLFSQAVGVSSFADFFAFVNVATAAESDWSIGGSGREISGDLTSPMGFLLFLPFGAFTAVFRPLPGEVNNVFGWLAGFEGLALVIGAVIAAARTRLKQLRHPAVLFSLCVVAVWSTFYSFISSQNLGTAVRYRLQAMPFVLFLIVVLGGRLSLGRGTGVQPTGPVR